MTRRTKSPDDPAKFLAESPGGRRSYLRRGSAHFDKPRGHKPLKSRPAVLITRNKDRVKPLPQHNPLRWEEKAVTFLILLALILAGIYLSIMFGFGSGLP